MAIVSEILNLQLSKMNSIDVPLNMIDQHLRIGISMLLDIISNIKNNSSIIVCFQQVLLK